MNRVVIYFVLNCLFFVSCRDEKENETKDHNHFDFQHYFQQEAEKLKASKTGITKTIIRNGFEETVSEQHPDWSRELQPFFQIDLNIPALSDAIKTDTVFVANQLTVIYTIKEKTSNLKKVEFYNSDSLTAFFSTSNIYHQSADTLKYFGNGNYFLSSVNKPWLGKSINFQLKGRTDTSGK